MGKIAQGLRTLAFLAKVLGSVPRTHAEELTTTSSGDQTASSGLCYTRLSTKQACIYLSLLLDVIL